MIKKIMILGLICLLGGQVLAATIGTQISGQSGTLVINEQPIIKLAGGYRDLTVTDRLSLVKERLNRHTAGGIQPDLFKVTERNGLIGVTYQGVWLLTADPESAYWQHLTQADLAELWCGNLRRVFEAEYQTFKVSLVFEGLASWYGQEFRGRRTANGEPFDERKFTAAHRSLPFGTKVRVTNPRNNRSVIATINDRGPRVKGRVIDLSWAAAQAIGLVGVGPVKVEVFQK